MLTEPKHDYTELLQSAAWQAADCVMPGDVPDTLRSWLLETESLTERFQQIARNSFTVKLLRHDWQRALPSEVPQLNLLAHELAYIREVELMIDGKVCVYGRSVFPAATLRGEYQYLMEIGTQPLGKFLFNDPTLQRSQFEIAALPARHEVPAEFNSMMLWARRSRLSLSGQSFLLTELFLPEILLLTKNHDGYAAL